MPQVFSSMPLIVPIAISLIYNSLPTDNLMCEFLAKIIAVLDQRFLERSSFV